MQQYDVSVILPFGDHEEIIGTAVARLSSYLREQELSFEIIAVDDESGDNSQAVLALIRKDIPELKIMHAPASRRGHAWGAKSSGGQVLWFIEPEVALASLSTFTTARARILRGERDLVAVDQRFLIAHRARCSQIVTDIRGQGRQFQRRLLRRARRQGLHVETPAERRVGLAAPRWANPLLAALSFTRTS